MDNMFDMEAFEHGDISFTVHAPPASLQNRGGDKLRLRNDIQTVTACSDYIITGTCWVAIDYYCVNIKRFKNPGIYDMDNIVKPILDSLVGQNGLIIDDVLIDRVTVNWIDTQDKDFFEVHIEYPDLYYLPKANLVFVKSASGWCLPTTVEMSRDPNMASVIQGFFRNWNSINTEDDYYNVLPQLPIQNFVHFGKINDRGYTFIDLGD